MLTTQVLRDILDKQRNILVDLNISINNMQRLKVDKYDFEKQIKLHGFFQHHWYQLKFISILQLSKLFSKRDTDKLSFHKLFSRLQTDSYGSDFQATLNENAARYNSPILSRENLSSLIANHALLIEQRSSIIEKIFKARDKVYAHDEPKVTVKYVTSDELRIMVELANGIYNSFEQGIFNSTHMFEFQKGWEIDFVLHQVSEQRKFTFKKFSE